MEPRIQYAKTEDGVNIAFSTMGEGMPLVIMPVLPYSHLEKVWQVPEIRRLLEWAGERRMLVWYDNRGSGLSERDVTDFSLEVHLLDLQAVVDRLGLDTFAIEAASTAGPVAITYAARHPERVSHLLLWGTYARASETLGATQVQAVLGLMEKDWELYTETLARYTFGWADEESARAYAALVRESMTQEASLAIFRARAFDTFDVSNLLGQVTSPTLVIHMRRSPASELDARALASGIPEASLAIVEDTESAVYAVDEFLGPSKEAGAVGGVAAEDIHTILFTDMESSAALAQRLGDAKAQEVRRNHNTIVREALKAQGGSEIKHTGDGIMASFTTASSALACAVAIQQGVAAHKEDHPDSPLGVYIGLNAGEPIVEDADLFGTSVDLAARLVDHAQPGQIIASDVVRQLAAGKDFLFSDLGETELRGFEDPVKLWEVRWRENAD